MHEQEALDFDFIVVGSGFGGSVSALRLAEKGYRTLILEKGSWFEVQDFPKSNWNVRRWLWVPALRFFGFFKLTFFRHLTVLSGVGVGGGSLVYANTMAMPKSEFFDAPTWAKLGDWQRELAPHYQTALRMLGAAKNPELQVGDLALQNLAHQTNKSEHFESTQVAVYFDEPEVLREDPYFHGQGPDRQGCTFCGGCMTGCQYNAKNTLDKNYLHLAQRQGARIQAGAEVVDITPLDGAQGASGYHVEWRGSLPGKKRKGSFTAQSVVLAGGALGTVDLLLRLQHSSLPNLSSRLGYGVRTNSESLIGVTTFNRETDFSRGVAIGSILHTDAHSHLEPVRYASGSGFWRLLMSPMVHGKNAFVRLLKIGFDLLRYPWRNLRVFTVPDWARRTQILLFMQTIESTLRFVNGALGMQTEKDLGDAPTAFIPEAKELADAYARIVNGKPMVLLTETILGNPTTAHILGGCTMGANEEEGVIDRDHRVFGYENLYICDGSTISSNPGVNPALTITALTERAMAKIEPKEE